MWAKASASGRRGPELQLRFGDTMKRLSVALSVLVVVSVATLLAQTSSTTTRRMPQFENTHVTVWKSIIMPKQPLSMHRHEFGRTIVALKGGKLTIVEKSGEKKIVDWETGKAYWLDADPPGTEHADVNEGSEPIEVMVIQMK